MFNGNKELVHSDLTAIITGPNAGNITATYPTVKVSPNRQKPFREFTIIYHDETGAVQAFSQFEQTKNLAPNDVLKFTLHSVRDSFAINYGTGGIGAEILANRLKVGPMGGSPAVPKLARSRLKSEAFTTVSPLKSARPS